jgi:hypothetical protein
MSVQAAIEKQDASKTQQKMDMLVPDQTEEATANSHPSNNEATQEDPRQASNNDPPHGGESSRIGRTSKRVRSQQISSDKKGERLRRRNSVTFCLRAATLSCTAEDESYRASSKAANSWDTVEGEEWKLPASLEKHATVSQKERNQSVGESRKRSEASERIGPSSLSFFLTRGNELDSGPVDTLLRYLGHVALHVEDVFSVDPADTMALTSCLMGCKSFFVLLGGESVSSLSIYSLIHPRLYRLRAGTSTQTSELTTAGILHCSSRKLDQDFPGAVAGTLCD